VPVGLPRRVAESIGRFTGRAWLLPRLAQWWDRSDERLFLLTGGPGTGKSMILAWLDGHGPGPAQPAAQALFVLRQWLAQQLEAQLAEQEALCSHTSPTITRRYEGLEAILLRCTQFG